MRLAYYGLAISAAVLAWALARRTPAHRPIAWACTAAPFANASRYLLAAYVLGPPGVVVTGALAWYERLDRALFLVWPACVVAVALTVLARRRAIGAAVAYVVAAGVIAAFYPEIRGEAIRKFYMFCDLAACAVGVVCLYMWARRGEVSTTPTRIAGVIIVAQIVTVIFGAYRFGMFGDEWQVSQAAVLVALVVIVLLQVGDLWNPRSSV